MKRITFFTILGLLGMVLLAVIAGTAQAALSDNLVTYYKADNSTSYPDELGLRNATSSGSTYTGSGKINGAYSYSGGTQYQSVTEGLAANVQTRSFWLYHTGNNYLFATSGGMEIYTGASGNLIVCFVAGCGTNVQTNTGVITNNVWTHVMIVAGTGGAGTAKIYINGSAVATPTNTATQTNFSYLYGNSLFIGSYHTGATGFSGRLDEIGMWNTRKNATDASVLWNSGAGCGYSNFSYSTTSCSGNVTPTNYFALTAVNNNTGSSVTAFNASITSNFGESEALKDKSGNNNTLTNNGATYNSTSSSFVFNGLNNYLAKNVTGDFSVGYSVYIDFYPLSNSGRSRPIANSNFAQFYYEAGSNAVVWFVGNGTTLTGSSTTGSIVDYNVRQNIIITYNGTTGTIYKNGTSIQSKAGNGLPSVSTIDDSRIGQTSQSFNGSIYRVIRWKKALTQEEITSLQSGTVNYTGLVAYYDFSDYATNNYSTTNGTVVTSINQSMNYTANVTVTADNYLSRSYTNQATNSSLVANLTPYTVVTVTDLTTGSAISGATVTYNGTAYTTNSTGSAQLPVSTSTYNFSVSATNYLTRSFTNQASYGTTTAQLFQAQASFAAYEIITNTSVTPFNITINGTTITNSGIVNLSAGTYNATFSRSGWFNKTTSITVSAATNYTYNITDTYAYILNLSARNNVSTASITSFNATVYGTGWSSRATTTNGSALVPISNGAYTVFFNTTGYAVTNASVNITATGITNTTLNAYTSESIMFRFYDETNNTLLNGINITVYLTSSSYSTNFTTSNGTRYIDLLTPTSYTITYTAPGYSQREYIYTVNDDSTTELNLYLLADSIDTRFTVNVLDTKATSVESATVKLQKKNLTGTNYYIVEMCQTDVNGVCLLSVNQYTTTYRFLIEYNNETKLNSMDTKIATTEVTFIINLETNRLSQYYELGSLTASLTNSTSGNTTQYSYTWNDVNGNSRSGCLLVYVTKGSTQTTLSNVCTATSAGTLTYTGSVSGYDELCAEATILYGDSNSTYPIDSQCVTNNTNRNGLGNTGLLLLLVGMGITVWLAYSYNPVLPPAAFLFLLYLAYKVGLFTIGATAFGAIATIIIIIIMVVL